MVEIAQKLIGQSPAWLVTLDSISGLAAIDKPILVVGENGTGKTSVAGRLHFLSPRWEQTWQAVNCAAMDGETLEARIFGAASGLATSLLEEAEGGTLFIDNIEAMPMAVQEKLLSMIETGSFKSIGSTEDISVDVRILSSSAVDLRAEVAEGRFSSNLLSVLAFDVITLPPLRARKTDIMPMAEKFAANMVTVLGEDSFAGFSAEVIEFLQSYDWPCNVRELKNVIERAVGRAWNDEDGLDVPITNINLDPFDTPWQLRMAHPNQKRAEQKNAEHQAEHQSVADQGEFSHASIPAANDISGKSLTERTDAFELTIIQEALKYSKNHQGKAAKYLGLTYHQFRGLLRKHGLKK